MQYRVLVTGGAGFIGSNLVDRLTKEGFLVTSIDNYSLGNCRALRNVVSYQGNRPENTDSTVLPFYSR